MTKKNLLRKLLLVPILLCSFVQNIFAQQPTVISTVDKTSILIGEQIQLNIKIAFDKSAFNINELLLPDSLPHFEIISKSKIDSSAQNNLTNLKQNITITSFDSGRWQLPAFEISFSPSAKGKIIKQFTDTIGITVGYAISDSSNQLRDIKPIIEVQVVDYFWYYVTGGILLISILAFLLVRYFKKRKKKPLPIFNTTQSAYEEAMQKLKALQQYNLHNGEELKKYHSELSTILKTYLSRKQNSNLLNKTTADLLINLKDANLNNEKLAEAATALRCSDAVKYAKFIPPINESENCFVKIQDTINYFQHAKPTNN